MTDRIEALPRPLAPIGVLQALAVLFIGLKLVLLFSAPVFQDEAYYWLWGQHPALAYYDHPPLDAWLQGISGALFGWTQFGVRFFVALAFLVDIGLLWLISRLVAPDWREHFWLTLLLFAATPLFFAGTTLALPDHLLITFVLAALAFFLGFLRGWPERPNWLLLFAGAACLGIGGLAKFNAAFLGAGLALAIVATPRLRPLLGRPQLYLAALLAVAPQGVVVLWNLGQDLASYRFIFGRRYGTLQPGFRNLLLWLGTFIIVIGPFLAWPMLRFGIRPTPPGTGLPRSVFWLSTAAILALAVVTETKFHWNIVAYTVALPFLAYHLRQRWLGWAHLAYGGAVLVALLVNFTGTPLGDVKARDDDATGWAYGWDQVAAAVRDAEARYGTDFVGASDYANASLLAFAMRDPDVTSFSDRVDQFDFWFDPAAHEGEDAILLDDYYEGFSDTIKSRFAEIVPIGEVPVVVNGQETNRHRLYLGRGFIADGR